MTTRVVSTVVTPSPHYTRISTQDKQADGTWVEAHCYFIKIGETFLHDGYITDTRRIVIEEVPSEPATGA